MNPAVFPRAPAHASACLLLSTSLVAVESHCGARWSARLRAGGYQVDTAEGWEQQTICDIGMYDVLELRARALWQQCAVGDTRVRLGDTVAVWNPKGDHSTPLGRVRFVQVSSIMDSHMAEIAFQDSSSDPSAEHGMCRPFNCPYINFREDETYRRAENYIAGAQLVCVNAGHHALDATFHAPTGRIPGIKVVLSRLLATHPLRRCCSGLPRSVCPDRKLTCPGLCPSRCSFTTSLPALRLRPTAASFLYRQSRASACRCAPSPSRCTLFGALPPLRVQRQPPHDAAEPGLCLL